MTVRELIILLSDCDPDAEVFCIMGQGYTKVKDQNELTEFTNAGMVLIDTHYNDYREKDML